MSNKKFLNSFSKKQKKLMKKLFIIGFMVFTIGLCMMVSGMLSGSGLGIMQTILQLGTSLMPTGLLMILIPYLVIKIKNKRNSLKNTEDVNDNIFNKEHKKTIIKFFKTENLDDEEELPPLY
ncbi:MAG: hypothetical protein ACRC42_03195 [Mycoplasma sp.]